MSKAIDGVFIIDKERANIERAVQTIYHHILRDYIAEANRREVMSNLYNFFKDSDVVIVSKPEWLQYQEWLKTLIDGMSLTANPIVIKE